MEGTPFGRYRLLELLGAGAMGEVHRAYDTGTDRLVAVKVLAPEYIHDTVYRTRFQREAHAAARLSEPHIVPIHDFGEIDGRLFLDMRLVEAPNLAKVLAEQERLAPADAVEVIAQIAAALDAAHAAGLVHRDVKPSNILRTPEGFAYLIDFGISRSDQDTTLTTTGVMVGTFAYMAPERLSQDESDARADVYSLACVLYECLAGMKPYRGESVHRQIAGHLNEQPPLPSEAGVPTPFDAVIAKGMSKDPDERYASAAALAEAARAALHAPAVPPGKDAPPDETATAAGIRAAAAGSTPPSPDAEVARPATTFPEPDARPTPAAAPATSTEPPPWRAASAAAVLVLGAACVTGVVMLTGDNTSVVTDAPGASTPTGLPAETTPPSGVAHTPAEPPPPAPPAEEPASPPSQEPVHIVPSAPGQQPNPGPDPPTTTTPVTTTAETDTTTTTPTGTGTTTTEPTTTETTTNETSTTETGTTETSTTETTTTTNDHPGGDDVNATGSTIATTPDADPTAADSASPTPADSPGPSSTDSAANTPTDSATPAPTDSAAPTGAG